MCGVAGFILKKKKSNKNNIKKINQILDLISYRGPDKKQFISNESYSFGTNRLAIESIKNGDQPIKFENLIVGFNGEIFNYKKLIKINNLNSSHIDSEVKLIAYLYKKYNEKFLDLIKGQFAIYIFDTNKNELFLARDKYGIRPIYYMNEADFVFASEIKCILKYAKDKINFSKSSLAQTCFFWTNIGDTTSFDKIKILPPGQLLKFDGKDLKVKRYFQNQIIQQKDENDITNDDFYELLNKAVTDQIHGEVGHACYLSGGIDSSLISALMAKVSKKKINTYTIGFFNNKFDESKYTTPISDHINSNHHIKKLDTSDALEILNNLLQAYDEPFSDSSQIPTLLLTKFASQHVKVALTGDGGDEMFGGYYRYIFNPKIWNYLKFIPKSIRPLFKSVFSNNKSISVKTATFLLKILSPRLSKTLYIENKLVSLFRAFDSNSLGDLQII